MTSQSPLNLQELQVQQVRGFFKDLVRTSGILVVCVLIWLLFAHTWYFWPGWVLVGVILSFGVRAHALGLLPFLGGRATARAAEIVASWEQAHVDRLTERSQPQNTRDVASQRYDAVSMPSRREKSAGSLKAGNNGGAEIKPESAEGVKKAHPKTVTGRTRKARTPVEPV